MLDVSRVPAIRVAIQFVTLILAALHSAPVHGAGAPTTEKAPSRVETYRDLITKAQNLTLQRDRLQTSQVLIRGLQRETRNSPAFKELVRTLDELTAVFYSEKAQTLFSTGEAQVFTKPREAIETLQEALRLEDGNIAILKSLARTQLVVGDCARADATVKSAEGINPYSAEVLLLRLQVLDCQKRVDLLSAQLETNDPYRESVSNFVHGLQIKDLLRRKEFKRARAILTTWEAQSADYPELHYWKWETSRAQGAEDRAAAVRYAQLCQNLTPRKRKSYILDVDLCKGKEAVDSYLKNSGFTLSAPAGDVPNE